MINFRNLVTRAVSGLFFVVAMIGCIWMSGIYFFLLSLLLTVLGLREFYKLSEKMEDVDVPVVGGLFGGALLCATVYFAFGEGENSIRLLGLNALVPPVMFIWELYRKKKMPLHNLSLMVMGWLYVAVPFAVLLYVDSLPMGRFLLLSFFVTIWASDSGAYLVGVLIGRHKMFERISPKKTWEGFAGGLLFSMIVAYLFYKHSPLPLALQDWIYIGLAIFVFGVLGDLVESLFKRSINVKDSGSFLPGHGGVLDRFDSALIAAPVLFCMALLLL